MTGSIRRSGRERKRPRYSEAAFDNIDPELQDGQDGPDRQESALPGTAASDDDFEASLLAERGAGDGSDDEPSDGSAALQNAGEADLEYQGPKQEASSRQEGETHSRGLKPSAHHINKDISALEIAGNDPELLEMMKRERLLWIGHVTLPTRRKARDGTGGLDHPQVYPSHLREKEESNFQGWYSQSGGMDMMAQSQRVEELDASRATPFMPSMSQRQGVLIGAYGNQKLHQLDPLQYISVPDAWQTATTELAEEGPRNASRSGWILNLGNRITWMDWAPNQCGDTQYLAVAVAIDAPPDHPQVSALAPSAPYTASFQIWAFKSKEEDSLKAMDPARPPRLAQVVCTEWGAVKRFSWCPVAAPASENQAGHVGLLAATWSDGHVRILDIKINPKFQNIYVRYHGAAFASKPPGSICTCVTWLSATQIAAGCANGCVAAWNIAKCILSQRSDASRDGSRKEGLAHKASGADCPAPFFYHPLHVTYVLSITAHHPFPAKFISTSAADGRVRLTSLRHPYSDTAVGTRGRHIPSPITYSPHILSTLIADENDGIRAMALRQFFFARTVARSSAQVTCMDAGKAHPSLLVGSADGTIVASNPIRRMYIRRESTDLVAAWQQVWFRHEWVPAKTSLDASQEEEPARGTGDEQALHQASRSTTPRRGISRFLESFKLQSVPLMRNANGVTRPFINKKVFKQRYSVFDEAEEGEGEGYATIQEEEQAVTCVVWNPNVSAGGWAAAGMASGLLRVEDLAI